MRPRPTTPRFKPHRAALVAVLAVATLLAVAFVGPADASMTKTRIMERDGQIVIVSQQVGNQAVPVQWVENDHRRHPEGGLTLTYTIDRTELPPGISWEDTEAAIESAVATFNDVHCAQNFELVRVDSEPGADLGVFEHMFGFGGSAEPTADITFAGWLPASFMDAVEQPGSMGLTVPAAFDAADGSPVWGYDVLNPTREYTDIDNDRKLDVFAMEIYFNAEANYVVDDDELGNTLFFIDLESIVLHELGHALGMDHFGRAEIILDENGNFVDIVLNQNSVPMMNSNNFFINREVAGSDKASFCGIYASWGKGPAAS